MAKKTSSLTAATLPGMEVAVDSRGASYPDATARTNLLQTGDIRPGFSANYFRTKPFGARDAVTCTVALTKAQRRHGEDAVQLRKKHGYRENEFI